MSCLTIYEEVEYRSLSQGSMRHKTFPSPPDIVVEETWNQLYKELDRDSFVTASISLNNSSIPIQTSALLDTGALHANYISVGLAAKRLGYNIRPCTSKVSSAVSDGRSVECLGELDLNLNYFDE